jgi:hypothetical protein
LLKGEDFANLDFTCVFNKLYVALTTINLNKVASKLSLFMSVARKTPKFADSSREEKWEKPSKKKSGSRISDYDFQDKGKLSFGLLIII